MIYRSILTNEGKSQLDKAIANGSTVNWNKFGVGDGNGTYIDPLPIMTDLVNRKWIGNLVGVYISDYNPGQVTFNGVIPQSVSGFTIREVGIFDENENLVAVSRCNFIELTEENETEVEIDFDLIVQDAEDITVVFEDSSFHVTRDYVDGKFNELLLKMDEKLEDYQDNKDTDYINFKKEVQESLKETDKKIEDLEDELNEQYTQKIDDLNTTIEDLNSKIEEINEILDTLSYLDDEAIRELFVNN